MVNSTLVNYVASNKDELIRKSVLSSKSARDFVLQTGVKTQAYLNLLDTEIVFGDGKASGWQEAGKANVSNRLLEAGAFKVNMSYEQNKFMDTTLQHHVRVAAGTEVLPFEERFTQDAIEKIGEQMEIAIFQGDKASTNPNLKLNDGLIKILKGEAKTIKVVVGSKTPKVVIDEVFMAIPAEHIGTSVIYVSPAYFRAYLKALQDANLYHVAVNALSEMETVYPGSSVKIKATPGIPADTVIALEPSMTVFGCDLQGDEEVFDFWFSKDNREYRFACNFVAGVQVAYPERCVLAQKA